MTQAQTQEREKLSVRTTFHVSPTMQARIDRAVDASPWDQPAWIRHVLEGVLDNFEAEEFEGSDISVEDVEDAPLAVQLAAARAQITGLKELNSMLNERLGMADVQNIELTKNLNITLGTVDRFTLALPSGRDSEAIQEHMSQTNSEQTKKPRWWVFLKLR